MPDITAERAVLAGIFQYGEDAYLDISDVITTSTFTVDFNQIIYRCIQHLFDNGIKTIDIASVMAASKAIDFEDFFSDKQAAQHLRAIANFPIHLENIRPLAIKIKKLELTERLRMVVQDSMYDLNNVTGDESLTQIFSLIENPIFNFISSLSDSNESYEHIGGGLKDYVNYLIENPSDYTGVPTGFPRWDIMLGGGIRRGTINFLGARTNQGKSMMFSNIAVHVGVKLKMPCLYLDTEMAKTGHWNRMLALLSNIKTNDIERSKFLGRQKKLMDAVELLENSKLSYTNVCGKTFDEIMSIMRRWVNKQLKVKNGRLEDCLILYDYLKSPNAKDLSSSLQEYQLLGFHTNQLHDFSVRQDIPMVVAVQLNRDGITKETTDIISQSDRIAWGGSSISILKPKEENEIAHSENRGNMKLIVIKSRFSAIHNFGEYIDIEKIGSIAKIAECEPEEFDVEPNDDENEF